MQAVSRNLEPSIMSDTLSKTSLEGNVSKIASVVVTCCKFLAERMEINSIEDAKLKIENLIKQYIKLNIMWLDNKKKQYQLCLVDRLGNVHQTGLCVTVLNQVFFIWLWKNPQFAMVESK